MQALMAAKTNCSHAAVSHKQGKIGGTVCAQSIQRRHEKKVAD